MTIQDTRTSRWAHSRPVPEQGAGVLRSAAAILEERYDVSEMFAYEILVHCAVDAGTSVREMAAIVVEGASQTH